MYNSKDERSLKNTTIRGIIWGSLERLSVQFIQFTFQVVLSRLLSPSDYGQIAMLFIFIAVSQAFIDSGFSNALISKSNRAEVDYNTVFYFNISISIGIYTILYFSAPYIALFYNIDQLTNITRVYALVLPICALGSIQKTQLIINVDFKHQAITVFFGTLVGSIIGIVLAYNEFGVWALIYSTIISNTIMTLLFWHFNSWRPKIIFSLTSLRSMFLFGSRLLLSGLVNSIYNNIYLLIIGKKYSSQVLGYYSKAEQLVQYPYSSITSVMQRVSYTVLCKVSGNKEKLTITYRKFLKLSAYIIFPLMIGLYSISEPLIIVLLGEKWKASINIIRILCFSYIWYPIHEMNLNLLLVKGRSDLYFKLEIIKKIIGIITLLGVINSTLEIIAFSNVAMSLLGIYINSYYTNKMINYSLISQLKDLIQYFILALISCIPSIVLCAIFSASIAIIIISIIISVTIYTILSKILNNEEYYEIVKIVKQKREIR